MSPSSVLFMRGGLGKRGKRGQRGKRGDHAGLPLQRGDHAGLPLLSYISITDWGHSGGLKKGH